MSSTKAPLFTASVVSFTLLLCLYALNSGSTTQNPLQVLKQDSEPTGAGENGLWQAMDSQNNIWTHEKHPNTALLRNFMAVGIGPAKPAARPFRENYARTQACFAAGAKGHVSQKK